jgi:nucleolar protein 58
VRLSLLTLIDDLAQEWYGWHFPEMAKIITDNIAYAKCIKAMGV